MGIIIYPQKIKKGDTVGVTAVSMPANEEKIDLAIDNLKELGVNVIETNNVRKEGIVSSDEKERAEELLELYKNPDVKYIIAARGGEFLMEMLPYLDEHRDIIRNNPKWMQGFSDPSLLNLYITTNFNIATINMENISEYAMKPRFKSLQDSLDFMFSNEEEFVQESFDKYQKEEFEEGNLKGYNLTEENIYECDENDVKIEGRIIGGCIDTFNLIAGTKMDNIKNFVSQFEEEGVIWYIDNCELAPCEFYRRLWYMDQMGYFKNIKGFLIGRSFVQRNDQYSFSFKSAVERALKKFNVPIIYDVDIGHVPPQMYIVNGSYAIFEYKSGKGKLIQKMI
jgi:muramoyltetrapeptide carboxypeptidase LdcA involved in peptidoglycan recycling